MRDPDNGVFYLDNFVMTEVESKATELHIKTQPNRLSYTEGEKMDLSGLMAEIIYDDGTKKAVALDQFNEYSITVSPVNGTELSLENNGKPVILTLGELTAETEVLEVKEKEPEPVVAVELNIKSQPDKLAYTEGEKLDLKGLMVEIIYSDGTKKEIGLDEFGEYSITASPVNGVKLSVEHNGKPVILRLNDLTAETKALEVKEKEPEPVVAVELNIKSQPDKLAYTEGEKLDLKGLMVEIIYSDGTKKEIGLDEFGEYIDTSNMNSEMILTCLSSFAQAESESISGNVTKGIRMGYRQGRFTFRYTNFLGYRKGADGQPEIVPEEAETIRLIAQSFLNGDSLYTIKQTLEHRGILTATGKTEWNTQAIQRILQNEKYMGDILLQKTYTADFIEGKVRKNRGELPQYYIRDNHPAIIPREMFFRIQEEINRRKSKKPTSTKKSKTNRGKFTSKYALSERLVCGECGSYFRRVTWNIHGRKQIVWRCVNRLENGPKACEKSVSPTEESLHRGIVSAIRFLVRDCRQEMANTLQETLASCVTEEKENSSLCSINSRLDELDREMDRLLLIEENEVVDLRIKQISEKILQLKQMKKRAAFFTEQNRTMAKESQWNEIQKFLTSNELNLTEYSDALVYRIIERIVVVSKEEIRIRFTGGLEITQSL